MLFKGFIPTILAYNFGNVVVAAAGADSVTIIASISVLLISC